MPANKTITGAVGALVSGVLLAASPLAMQAASAGDCSGIMCIFGSRPAAAPAPSAPQAAPAAVPAPATATTGPAATTTGPAATTTADISKDEPKPARKARPKPVPVVTIAADPASAARLESLVAVVRRPHVRLVEAKDSADFAVTTTLDGQGGDRTRLFGEAMHVVAGAKVRSLADLRGRAVSFGADGSASQAVARKAFAAAGVEVAETPLEVDNALDGLATGDIVAVVILAPQPDARLAKISSPGLHLVAWPDGAALPDGAVASAIDGSAYPGLAKPGDKVAALGVDAVLVESPKARRQPGAKAFLGALSKHSAALGKRGFGLLEADLGARRGRRVANNEAR